MAWSLLILAMALLVCHAAVAKKTRNFRVSTEITTGWTSCRSIALHVAYHDKIQPHPHHLNDSDNIARAGASSSEDFDIVLNLLHGHVKRQSDLMRLLRVNLEMETAAPKMQAIAIGQASHQFPDCEVFVEYARGTFVCRVSELADKTLASGNLAPSSLDHVIVTHRNTPLLRIYSLPGSEKFNAMLGELKQAADLGTYSLVHQHLVRPKHCPFYEEESRPTGYGLEFEIKSAHYVVEEEQDEMDDSDSTTPPILKTLGITESLEPLTAFNAIKESPHVLGKSLQAILNHGTFESLVQHATSLVWMAPRLHDQRISVRTLQEMRELQSNFDSEHNIYRINSLDMASANVDPFRLLDFMNMWMSRLTILQGTGLPKQLMRLLFSSRIDSAAAAGIQCFNLQSPAIVFLNDLERDVRYQQWPRRLADLERIGKLPGVFLAKNIQTVIFAIDIAHASVDGLMESILQLISVGFPLRIGLLPVTHAVDSTAASLLKTFYAVKQQSGLRASVAVLRAFVEWVKKDSGDPSEIIKRTLNKLGVSLDEASMKYGDAQVDETLRMTRLFSLSTEPTIFSNGDLLPLSKNLPEVLLAQYRVETERVQRLAKQGRISDSTADIYAVILADKKPAKRRNKHLEEERNRFVGDTGFGLSELKSLLSIGNYVVANGSLAEHSAWLAGDFSRESAFSLAIDALELTRRTPRLRTRIFPLSAMTSIPNRILIAATALLVEQPESLSTVIQFLRLFAQHFFSSTLGETVDLEKLARAIQQSPVAEQMFQYANRLASETIASLRAENERFFATVELDWRTFLLYAVNGNGVLVSNNGTDPSDPSDPSLDVDDLEQFTLHELELRGIRHVALIDRLKLRETRPPSETVLVLAYTERLLLAEIDASLSHLLTPSTTPFPPTSDTNTIQIGDSETSLFHVEAILNPFNRNGQKFSSIFNYLATTNLYSFSLTLNTNLETSDPRTTRLYRFITPEHKDVAMPVAPVDDPDMLIAMSLDLPAAWLTVTTHANTDLDNIRPTKVPHLQASFHLKHLLVEGQATFADDSTVAVGSVVQLFDAEGGLLRDQSSVMANYGYYQVKAQPGDWLLRVIGGAHESAPKEYPVVQGGVVHVVSFSGVFNRLQISRNAIPIPVPAVPRKQAEINVFSLASGLFYERLLRIMIASVMRHTKTSVKFWFLETTLSPQGREALATLSAHYGFQYELMAYKWPFWLNQQTKKHRTIWAYKILFLDVLFPQDLSRVIFIDADQVVRTDMHELATMDLQDHVYAMTPFCRDRPDMADYRFWEHNFWKNHLNGRPYHISALFVVNLVLLRQRLVADTIRSQYEALSRDPNSLANLDQDLPNSLQHHIPILSLPQEWLWCDTWCSGETKARARTIDLCNNPKTMESKFAQAVRIIPEWSEYDDEIRRILQEHSPGRILLKSTGESPAIERADHVARAESFEHVEL